MKRDSRPRRIVADRPARPLRPRSPLHLFYVTNVSAAGGGDNRHVRASVQWKTGADGSRDDREIGRRRSPMTISRRNFVFLSLENLARLLMRTKPRDLAFVRGVMESRCTLSRLELGSWRLDRERGREIDLYY